MKIRIYVFLAAAALLASVCCSQYDDGAILARLDQLEKDVADLKKATEKANSEISALKTLVEIVKNNQDSQKPPVEVSEVRQFDEDGQTGWLIIFSNGESIKVYNGKDSKAPVMGVAEIGGVYYWTVDGEFLINPDTGEKVQVTGNDGAQGAPGEPGAPGTPGGRSSRQGSRRRFGPGRRASRAPPRRPPGGSPCRCRRKPCGRPS